MVYSEDAARLSGMELLVEGASYPALEGRDEMNLSEYPIALLADRAPSEVKTLFYKDRDETLTITGSDLHGLPTAGDVDVIIALLHLTKAKNDFTDPTLHFTRYELLKVLRWPDRGHYYERLTESLNRWVATTLIYKRAWWDNQRKAKGNISIHILDAVVIVERAERNHPSTQGQLSLSHIRWGKEFFQSCQANNLKRLDLGTYFSLKSSISKQLYRFLDKRFYKKPSWTFDLRTLACEHVGLSRNYPSWKVKQKLQPAIDELVEVGFLKRQDRESRYRRKARGEWDITLTRSESASYPPREAAAAVDADHEVAEQSHAERELASRGVSLATARELVSKFPEARILRQIDQVEWLKANRPNQVRVSLGGYLVKAIREDFSPPDGYESREERERKRREAEEAERQELARKRRAAAAERRAKEQVARVSGFWKGLTDAEQEAVRAEALEAAGPEVRMECGRHEMPSIRDFFFKTLILDPYIRRKLGLPPAE